MEETKNQQTVEYLIAQVNKTVDVEQSTYFASLELPQLNYVTSKLIDNIDLIMTTDQDVKNLDIVKTHSFLKKAALLANEQWLSQQGSVNEKDFSIAEKVVSDIRKVFKSLKDLERNKNDLERNKNVAKKAKK